MNQKNGKKILIFLGPPGSGKGTQAVRLAAELQLPHISTGDLFRHHIKNETPLGLKAKEYINKGLLSPDELVFEILKVRLEKPDTEKGFILDGFPRRISQAEELKKMLDGSVNMEAIDFEVPDQVIIDRISGRLQCTSCGNTQHKIFQPPKVEGVCDLCGGKLITRDDDQEEVVMERLNVYHKETEPLIGYYRDLGLLKVVDANQTPEKVYQEVLKLT